MSRFDTILRNASVVTPEGVRVMDVGIAGGSFAELGASLRGEAVVEIDATGRVMFPGLVDVHVHFNEPGRTEWEGFATGSASLAAGGGTCFIDMPLNSHPPVLDVASLMAKRRAGEANSRLDFALWGGLTPESVPKMADLARSGVAGFKAFLCASGIDEFSAANEACLRKGMHVAAEFNLPVAVHAESPAVIAAHQREFPPPRPGTMADWLGSRPVAAEIAAIEMALSCAKDTGCALHVVHVSAPEGIELIAAGKREGIDVTAETCPHYLLLDTWAAERIGAAAKCAPPLRSPGTVEGLWRMLRAGMIDTIGSDHSPSPPELKEGDDVFSMWGGIAGSQHGFPLVVEKAVGGGVTNDEARMTNGVGWEMLAAVFAGNPARRFRLDGLKGRIAEGMDADFCLLRADEFVIETKDLLARHPISPYVGMRCAWRVEATWLRGNPVSPATHGRFLTPDL
ncbi:allantoinase AllB [Luteolibacter sp. GHJ8]|uniref:Allantoinase AllB n=1 Tax=Luteolibacter rhizosphaerae TaxID=2989719 RepID=A0ABT3FZ12_9BACT|nr:allantoinase AllB [Luteolibacter rhizosphaerae]MCW1912835.1 allantoinase AllB [Luteolibacter rhizosphaerae]